MFQSKSYDSVTEKYLDFSFEKTNSAYMLFYERRLPDHLKQKHADLLASPTFNVNRDGGNDTSDIKSETIAKQKENIKESDDKAEKPQQDEADNIEIKSNKNDNKDCNMEPQASTSAAAAAAKNIDKPSIATSPSVIVSSLPQFSKELEDWIWQDNRQFLQDRNIFEHTYFK